MGLLGPNGSGKTTAVRILSTILSPTSGSASILGLDVAKQADAVRRTIGLAGQYATVDENLTGRENIRMVGQLTHMSKAGAASKADELLERFSLTDAGNRPVKTYSGGMRRRLDLAASLVAAPPLLFLDEPTTGLDPQSRNDLWEIIEQLVTEGTTVLLTTQYLEEADRLADDGTTVVEVSFADHAAADRGLELIRSLTEKEPIREGSMVELTVENGPRVAADVLRALDAAQLEPLGRAIREPSLDDVFLSLTGRRTAEEVAADESTSKKRRRGDKESQ